MKIENGILYLSEPILDFNSNYICVSENNNLVIIKSDMGHKVDNNTLWVGVGQGEYNYKIQDDKIILTPKGMIPEIVRQAQKIMGCDKQLSDITKDDILEKIFALAHECQETDPKQAVVFKVAIDTFQWLYEQIRKQPPKKISHDTDSSSEFLTKWGIKNE